MKKTLIFLALTLVTFTANAQSYTYDVNHDGVINITDVSCLVNKILGGLNPGEAQDTPTLQLSPRILELTVGALEVVNITSGSGNYTVYSSDDAVATAAIEGSSIKVTAMGIGQTFITVTDTKSGQAETINVTVKDEAIPSFFSCPDDNHPHLIDLGLPSRTRWACCNVGANSPEATGGRYAWGETVEKTSYDWDTYTLCEGTYDTCLNIGEDIAGTQYDVAHVKWGGYWQMPSLEQTKELLEYCTTEWTTENGVKGTRFIGANGASIFFSAWWGSGLSGYYWLSTYSTMNPYYACMLPITESNYGSGWSNQRRCQGNTVRPVYVDGTPHLLVLSMNSAEIFVGESATINITSGNGAYTVSNSDPTIAKASLSGNTITITGVATGSTMMTVTDTTTGTSLTISVDVVEQVSNLSCPDNHHPHLIDLGLPSGTKWACCNVGAKYPKDSGGYYAWGETEEKAEYNLLTYSFYERSNETFYDIGSDIAGTQYDVAHVIWNGSWMMPSNEQIKEFFDNCSSESLILNGVIGRRFIGLNGNSIFLPLAGSRIGKDSPTKLASYWSSTWYPSESRYASSFGFSTSGYIYSNTYSDRYKGNTVRPISK